ncbi:hypothetical protein Nepgr_001274 [Nepenthes gracilis]|uniref:Uncharacterized protein n=1 Tax=Nepenthes gracilis TaxID=150966 RepID=A0AAD3RXM5_NEPGR|nr:hypothetical protein Nepgr_001274 [Nepenthes gracilis]
MPENFNHFPSLSQNLTEFDNYVSQPNPASNPVQNPDVNSNPNPSLIQSSFSIFHSISSLNVNQDPTSHNFLTVTIPRRRRRGRPRSTTTSVPSQTQVFSIPQILRNSVEGSNTLSDHFNVVSASSSSPQIPKSNLQNPSSSAPNVPDISEEIIVINKEATAEALTALTAGVSGRFSHQ